MEAADTKMIICVTSKGKDLEAEVDPRFGRCSFFIFIDSEMMQYEAVENPWKEASSGAGVQAAQFVIKKGAKKILTGKVGTNAEEVLKRAKVAIIEGNGKIKDLIENIKDSK